MNVHRSVFLPPQKKRNTGVFCCSFVEPRIWVWLLVTHKTWSFFFAHATAALPQVLLPPQTRSLPLRCRSRPGVGFLKFVFCFFSSDVLWVYGEAISFGFWQVDFPKMTTSLLYHPENDSTGSFTSSTGFFPLPSLFQGGSVTAQNWHHPKYCTWMIELVILVKTQWSQSSTQMLSHNEIIHSCHAVLFLR